MNADHPVAKQLAAYNGRDIEAYIAAFSPNIEVYHLSNAAPYVVGREQLKEIWGDVFERSPNLHCKVVHRSSYGDFVIDHEEVTGHCKAPEGLKIAAIYQIANDEIIKVWFSK